MASLNSDTINRIKAINWFAHCGEPVKLPLPPQIFFVPDWANAKRYYRHPSWEDTTLEARNALTSYLFDNHTSLYTETWNQYAALARDFVQTYVHPRVTFFAEQSGLDDIFVACVRWDVIGAIQEDAYKSLAPPVNLFTELLNFYEAGHFPYGWRGGKWPEGELVVI